MGKSRAEIQRAYRERKKQELGELVFLEQEADRQKKHYVKAEDLQTRKLAKRREKTRESVAGYCIRQKEKVLAEKRGLIIEERKDESDGPCDSTTTPRPHSTRSSTKLVVKFPVMQRTSANKRAVNRQKVQSLKLQNTRLQRKV